MIIDVAVLVLGIRCYHSCFFFSVSVSFLFHKFFIFKTAIMSNSSTIFLNRGMPSDDMCGRELFEACLIDMSKASHVSTFSLLNYGDDEGPLEHRQALASFLNEASAEIASKQYEIFKPENFFATSGNSHAMSVLSTMLLHVSPPEPPRRFTVLCDDPTYPFAKVCFFLLFFCIFCFVCLFDWVESLLVFCFCWLFVLCVVVC
jgi:DNA-binding transcriptional MocR family regulator